MEEKYNIIINNLKNKEEFFEMINNCKNPVYISLCGKKKVDIRKNYILQYLILLIVPVWKITGIQISGNIVKDGEDIFSFLAWD